MEIRDKKLCLVSHCILNCYSKLEGSSYCKGPLNEVIYPLIEKGYGIIQLPCPEISYFGMRRWGHAKEQFDNPFFRKYCRSIIEPLILQIQEYINNGYTLSYVIGINGSPSCGIDLTCTSKVWRGEISKWRDIDSIKNSLSYEQAPGVFMEELMRILKESNINTNYIGIYEGKIQEYDFTEILK